MNYYYEAEGLYKYCYIVNEAVVGEFLLAMRELGAVVHQLDAIPFNWDCKRVHGIVNVNGSFYFF